MGSKNRETQENKADSSSPPLSRERVFATDREVQKSGNFFLPTLIGVATLMDRVLVSSYKDVAPVCCGEEGVELKDKALSLLVCLPSNPLLLGLGHDPKNQILVPSN